MLIIFLNIRNNKKLLGCLVANRNLNTIITEFHQLIFAPFEDLKFKKIQQFFSACFFVVIFISTWLIKYNGIYFTPYAHILICLLSKVVHLAYKKLMHRILVKNARCVQNLLISSFWMVLDLRKSLAVLKAGSQQLGLQKSFSSVVNAEIPFSAKSASCLINLKFHHSPLPSHNFLIQDNYY